MNNFEVNKLFDYRNKKYSTNWVVISGAPSSGKTTLINRLSEKGYKTNPDISRQVIEKYLSQGYALDQIYSDNEKLQKEILLEMFKSINSLALDELVFFDYSFPDNIPFLNLSSIKVAEEFEIASKIFTYHKVFICEPLKIEEDRARKESKESKFFYKKRTANEAAKKLHAAIQDYTLTYGFLKYF
jgi:predicted ATPase